MYLLGQVVRDAAWARRNGTRRQRKASGREAGAAPTAPPHAPRELSRTALCRAAPRRPALCELFRPALRRTCFGGDVDGVGGSCFERGFKNKSES